MVTDSTSGSSKKDKERPAMRMRTLLELQDEFDRAFREARAWRDVWSAGHGVASIHDAPPVRELCDRLAAEYRAACGIPPSPAVKG